MCDKNAIIAPAFYNKTALEDFTYPKPADVQFNIANNAILKDAAEAGC